MFERKLTYSLGTSSKKLLRTFKGKKRMTIEQYVNAVDEYNAEIDKLRQQDNERISNKKLNRVKYELNNQLKKIADGSKKNFSLKINNFVEKFKSPVVGFKYLLQEINNKLITKNIKIDIVFNNKHYAINSNTINKFTELLLNENINEIETATVSDAEFIGYFLNSGDNDKIIIKVFEPTNKNKKYQGDFFKYYHNTHFDFLRYGIHSDKPDKYPNNCIIEALQNGGLNDDKLQEAKLLVNTKHFPKSKLNELANKLNIKIKLSTIKDNARIEIYGESEETYNIALFDEHYFLNEKTNITRFSLENYEQVKNIKNCENIKSLNPIKRDSNRCIDSLTLVKILIENKETLLRPIQFSDLLNSQYYEKVEENLINLEYDSEKYTSKVTNKKIEDIKSTIVYFDFETVTKNIHIPYLCCILNDKIKNSFIGSDCGLQMLKFLSTIYDDVLLIAHNASYDFRFILEYLTRVEETSSGNSIYSVNGYFNKLKISIKDSYKLITMPLKDFSKTFNIKNTVKEVISYNFYNNTDAINSRYVLISEMEKYLIEENKDIEQFRNNLIKWDIKNGEKFDAIEYSNRYCQIDCEILKTGYETFRKWMLELAKLDINNILTIASLSHRYLINEGCYEGVYNLSGIPRAFIQRCVVGGRVMCANNEKRKYEETNKNIIDFDAVSLYPSAMARLDGFLLGIPKVITNFNYENIKNYDGYFIEIVIKNVGIKRAFPLMSYKNDDGVRIFSNEMKGKILFVDKITLEDLIKFQNIEFDIIRGYYFDNGFNTQINKTILKIFNERLRLKKEGNPAEIVYKLIMNSAYGKSIMKPREDEIRYFDNEEKMNIYKSRHYCWVKTSEKIENSNLWKIKNINPLSDHSNIAHIGVSVLSMSKRIMNEVMCCAEDNSIDLFYQDTDSMHLYNDDIEKLQKLFNGKYNRELIGKQLGQFHSDFDLKGCENVTAKRSIFLGKKCYIDELQGIDENGNIKNGYHIRMKGIPNSTIKYTAQKMNITEYQLYEKLYDGEKIEFDLTENNKKSNFKFHSNGLISTLGNFKRELTF
jgi:hypothetical protein